MLSTPSIAPLLDALKFSGQDYEFYPTTPRMVDIIARHMDKGAESLLDVGAGDGRVLLQLATHFSSSRCAFRSAPPTLYAIEKSPILIQSQPENVIPVGTDLFEQNLACLPVDYIFSNPPYSEYELWAVMIIESGYARKSFLIIPQRWKDNPAILSVLKKRGATARILHSDNFLDAERRARAVVDIVEITYPTKGDASYGYGGRYSKEVRDPFDVWFDANIHTFQEEEPTPDYESDHTAREKELARIRHLTSIAEMVEQYREEYSRMEENYRAIFKLDYALLKELGINKENVRDGIKAKMAGLKAKYWTLLFERLSAITNRLSTATKAKFTEKLLGRNILAFTADNAYAIALWAIKNANAYFDEQTVQLYKDLSTFDGVFNYKSNIRTWKKADWRYNIRNYEDGATPTHYALDYRIVMERYRAIGNDDSWYYPHNLAKECHDTIADVVAVMFNLGFPSSSPSSMDRGDWRTGEWQDWYRLADPTSILFQVKAHKNGNLHFRFLPDAIKALNVEAGRLLGWLRDPDEVVRELGYSREEAERYYSCTRVIGMGSAVKLLGSGEE